MPFPTELTTPPVTNMNLAVNTDPLGTRGPEAGECGTSVKGVGNPNRLRMGAEGVDQPYKSAQRQVRELRINGELTNLRP